MCVKAKWLCHYEEYLPDQCIISSLLQFPPTHTHHSWFLLERGSHTLHLLHPEAAPLMGVPSIVVLLLLYILQEWLESFLSGVGKTQRPDRKKNPFDLPEKRFLFCFFPTVFSHLCSFCLSNFYFSLFVQCRLLGCPVKQSRHAWIQASGVRLWRCGQVCFGEYDLPILFLRLLPLLLLPCVP